MITADACRDIAHRYAISAINTRSPNGQFAQIAAALNIAARVLDEGAVERLARVVAQNGFGRPWDDFLPVNAHDTDQSDLQEYARAVLAYLKGESHGH